MTPSALAKPLNQSSYIITKLIIYIKTQMLKLQIRLVTFYPLREPFGIAELFSVCSRKEEVLSAQPFIDKKGYNFR